MNSEAYLRELAAAITQQEDITDAEAKDVLYELALRMRSYLRRGLSGT